MTPTHRTLLAALSLCAAGSLALFATSCQSDRHGRQAGSDEGTVAAPSLELTEPTTLPGLHNVVTYGPELVCGGVPEGAEGLHTLKAMGIRTVVSVDGATPNVDLAESLGMRYVHLPISYDGVAVERQREIAQVLANAERPIYVHCHHGRHRSAAALGVAAVRTGELSQEQACARMTASGTSENYPGLWAAVRGAAPLAKEELEADIDDFPSLSQVSGIVEIMAELDIVYDLVQEASDAAWQVPADHPDLVPVAETRRLASLLARLRQDPESQQYEQRYQDLLEESIERAERLDQMVRSGTTAGTAELADLVGQSCKACHKIYRNQ